jgi:hypothetical protein
MWRAEYTGEWSGADDSEEDESNVSTFVSTGVSEQAPEIDLSEIDRPHDVGHTNGDYVHIYGPGGPVVPRP